VRRCGSIGTGRRAAWCSTVRHPASAAIISLRQTASQCASERPSSRYSSPSSRGETCSVLRPTKRIFNNTRTPFSRKHRKIKYQTSGQRPEACPINFIRDECPAVVDEDIRQESWTLSCKDEKRAPWLSGREFCRPGHRDTHSVQRGRFAGGATGKDETRGRGPQ
jgi:hypothetical protein